MREKSIGGAPVAAAPINRFATALTRERNCRLCNTSHRATARLRFVAARGREIRHFVTDRTNPKIPNQKDVGNGGKSEEGSHEEFSEMLTPPQNPIHCASCRTICNACKRARPANCSRMYSDI